MSALVAAVREWMAFAFPGLAESEERKRVDRSPFEEAIEVYV